MKKLITLIAASCFAVSAFADNGNELMLKGIQYDKSGNNVKAVEFYKKSLAAGTKESALLLGENYYARGDYKQALKYFQMPAGEMEKQSDTQLGAMYMKGQGVAKDYTKASTLFLKASKLGGLTATYNLAQNYYFGEGISKDKSKAIQLYTQSANGGYAQAQNQLGGVYSQKDPNDPAGVSRNLVQGYYWITLADLNGSKKAKSKSYIYQNLSSFNKNLPYCISLGQDNVSQAYKNGIGGLKKSQSEALEWMEKAQATDPTLSIVNLDLAKMYALNDEKDKAFEFAQKAVTQPYAPAMQYLGTMYQQGIGTSKNLVKAYAYLSLAESLYKNPDDKFFSTFAAPCMPNYKQTTKEFNVDVTLTQLNELHLSDQAVTKAKAIMKKVKDGWKPATK